MIALVLVLLAVPFRLIYHSEFPERIRTASGATSLASNPDGCCFSVLIARPTGSRRGPDKVQPAGGAHLCAPGTFPL
jgi:hypothetical protein